MAKYAVVPPGDDDRFSLGSGPAGEPAVAELHDTSTLFRPATPWTPARDYIDGRASTPTRIVDPQRVGGTAPNFVSLVIPTLNEVDSLPRLISALDRLLQSDPCLGVNELVFVDDGSTDGTVEFISQLGVRATLYSVRLISRRIRHGPAHAELAGIKQSANEFVLKLDGDGQHDVEYLPRLIRNLDSHTELVVASRYVAGGNNAWPPIRGFISRVARFMSQILISNARQLRDPVSGFFAVKRSLVMDLDASLPRYKLLLHILAANPRIRTKEIPITMGHRCAGESKIVGPSLSYVTNFTIELVGCWKVSMKIRHQSRASG
jgi:glycosyltransferase involved in cell wall biosynthesis